MCAAQGFAIAAIQKCLAGSLAAIEENVAQTLQGNSIQESHKSIKQCQGSKSKY
ncbi:hypothetical protein M1N46_01935 [Dehalococcoidia bacterium]|nr:hypothetical protein [Dehalococcoidia bacterium]